MYYTIISVSQFKYESKNILIDFHINISCFANKCAFFEVLLTIYNIIKSILEKNRFRNQQEEK